ncbi:MAG TPA: hypothetical protein VI112_18470 [Bacteroidia bacterium]|jgi:hypothetical protein
MDIKQRRREITELIDSIKEHSDDLTDRPHIPTLEFELILAKVEKLFKELVLFNHYYSEIETSSEKVEVNTTAAAKKTEAPSEKKTEVKKDSIQRTWPDLKNLIGINQKFQVVSELFKGNQEEFNDAVNQINTLYNKEEALIYVQGLKAAYGWKDESPVAEGFIKVVMNRYQ